MKIGIVFDANVYIASLKRGTYSEYWLRQASITPEIKVSVSEEILREVQEKLESRFGLSRRQATDYIAQIREVSTVVTPREKLEVVERDPDDNKIIECAVEAGVQMVITMDRDLLDMKNYENVQFVNPRMLQYLFTRKQI